MSDVGGLKPDPTAIGDVVTPPLARLPDPVPLFARRATRLRVLARGHQLAPYLSFLADLAEAQARIQDGLPPPALPEPDVLERAAAHAMPPLDRNRFAVDATYRETEARLLAAAGAIAMPEVARAALDQVAGLDAAAREQMARAVLADAIPVETMAAHVFVAAALQVHFARTAARLDAERLVAVGDGACPACGGPPVASLIVGWPNAQGARYCACALCQTLWNYVRVKCTVCGSTKNIRFQHVAEGAETIKAETCEDCRCYVKVVNQQQESEADPVADDVASLGLDLLVRESGYRRGAFNPFLLGY